MLNPLHKITQQRKDQQQADAYRALIRHEAKIGGELFGPIPTGHRREFFCLDRHTWVWHEEWTDQEGKPQRVTTRYDVRPNGVFKVQANRPAQPLAYEEAINFYEAVHLYQHRVGGVLRRLLPVA